DFMDALAREHSGNGATGAATSPGLGAGAPAGNGAFGTAGSGASGSAASCSAGIECVIVHCNCAVDRYQGVDIYLGYTDTFAPYNSHTFVVARDRNTGDQYATRAGPNIDLKTGEAVDPNKPWGTVHAVAGVYDENFPDYKVVNAPLQYVGQLNVSLASIAASMNSFATAVNNAGMPYLLLGSNSNTYASTYLHTLGFNPTPTQNAPGWMIFLPNEKVTY
ncbi:MAG TPA: hypothetical protein VGC79_34420, partial [Polyangiaceae bacterium]